MLCAMERNELPQADMIYDLVITQTEGMHYYDAVCVRNGSVYALVLDKHFKEEKKEYEPQCLRYLLQASTHRLL